MNYLMICIGLLLSFQEDAFYFPKDGFEPGWVRSGPILHFVEKDLSKYIDSGETLFYEFGFEELLIQRYKSGDDEISIEVYHMDVPEAALGVYLMKCGIESPVDEIPARNSGSRLQYLMVKNKYFIILNNYTGSARFEPVMISMSRHILESIPKSDPVELMSLLPKENRQEKTEFIFRGPYALEAIYTFGEDDILLLDGKVFGVVGDYRTDEEQYTQMIIPYPRRDWAKSAIRSLIRNLDPVYEVIEAWDEGLIFKDFQNKFGIALLNGNILDIRIKLSSEPQYH